MEKLCLSHGCHPVYECFVIFLKVVLKLPVAVAFSCPGIVRRLLASPEPNQNGVMGPEGYASTSCRCCGQTIPVSNMGLTIFGGPSLKKFVLEFGMAVTFSFLYIRALVQEKRQIYRFYDHILILKVCHGKTVPVSKLPLGTKVLRIVSKVVVNPEVAAPFSYLVIAR